MINNREGLGGLRPVSVSEYAADLAQFNAANAGEVADLHAELNNITSAAADVVAESVATVVETLDPLRQFGRWSLGVLITTEKSIAERLKIPTEGL